METYKEKMCLKILLFVAEILAKDEWKAEIHHFSNSISVDYGKSID
jgi:hypothetical protein